MLKKGVGATHEDHDWFKYVMTWGHRTRFQDSSVETFLQAGASRCNNGLRGVQLTRRLTMVKATRVHITLTYSPGPGVPYCIIGSTQCRQGVELHRIKLAKLLLLLLLFERERALRILVLFTSGDEGYQTKSYSNHQTSRQYLLIGLIEEHR